MKWIRRILAGMLVVGVPLVGLVLMIHSAHKVDARPVVIPPPLSAQPLPPVECSPYARRRASERAEYLRGYDDAVRGRRSQP